MKLTALFCSKTEPNDDATSTSHEQDTEYLCHQNAKKLTDLTYLQAREVKLLDKCPPGGTFRAIKIDMAKRHQQDHISNKANRKIEIN
jgi:hypothetical protein